MRRLGLLCVSASSVEWYDFFLYATAAALVFPDAFFTPLGPTAATLASFTTFALAFVARPLGGLLFGVIGDRAGRRTALAAGTIAMGAATALVGALPTYATIGVAAPILLTVLRLAQGLALGGQWAGSVLLLTEQAPEGRRGVYGGIGQLGSPIGGTVANLLFFLLYAGLPREDFAAWGWRIPFLVSLLFVGLGLVVQRQLEDSAAFRRLAERGDRATMPVAEVLRRRPGQVLIAAGLLLSAGAGLWIYVTFLLTYVPRVTGLSRDTALLLVPTLQVLQIVGILAATAASDRYGRRPVHLVATVALAIWAVPSFLLLDSGSLAALVVALVVVHLILGSMYGPLAAMYTEMFSTRVRYSGASIGYQLGSVLGGGLAPIIATVLVGATGSSLTVAGYVVLLCVVTVVSTVLLREGSRTPLEDEVGDASATRRAVGGAPTV